MLTGRWRERYKMVSEILGNLKAWISISILQFLASQRVSLTHYIKMCNIVMCINFDLLIHADNYIVYHANKFTEIKSNQTSCLLNPCRDALSINLLRFPCSLSPWLA